MTQAGSEARLVDASGAGFRVEGVLGFDTVSRLLVDSDARFQPGRTLRVDLAGVTSANSAGLALILEWLDLARQRDCQLALSNLPESIARIAAFSNLTDLLPIQDPDTGRSASMPPS